MFFRRGAGHRHDRDPLVTLACVLAIAFAFFLLWGLGVPFPLLAPGLLLSCLVACLLFMLIELRSHRKAQAYLARLQRESAHRPGRRSADGG